MSRLLTLQHALLDLALDADPEPFRRAPGAWAGARGLGAEDGAALATQAPRFGVYRDLVRFALEDPLPDACPIAHALLREAGAWEACVDAFLASRTLRSPYYRDVAPTFVTWLAESGWGLDRWPFLLALVHWEVLELELLRHPDLPAPPEFQPEPGADRRAVPEPTLRNLTYPWAVHRATEENPEPAAEPTHLLAWRSPEGDFESLVLSASASALVARWLEGEPLGAAAEAVEVDTAEALSLAATLHAKGALSGFR